MEQEFDVVVIGSGPGGEGSAMQLAKGGMRVAVVESFHQIGGGCTHWGTIPSKSLRYAIYSITEALSNSILRECGVTANPTLAQLRSSSKAIIAKQVAMRQTFTSGTTFPSFKVMRVSWMKSTVEVGDELRLRAKSFVIATGSRPFHPEGVDFSHPRIFDSDTVLDLSFKPQSITIYGAGVIGCEYASMFRNLGIKVNLVNTRAKLLEFLDDEIIDALSYQMRESGVLIRHNETFERIEGRDDGVVLYLQSGKVVKTDILLWSTVEPATRIVWDWIVSRSSPMSEVS